MLRARTQGERSFRVKFYCSRDAGFCASAFVSDQLFKHFGRFAERVRMIDESICGNYVDVVRLSLRVDLEGISAAHRQEGEKILQRVVL